MAKTIDIIKSIRVKGGEILFKMVTYKNKEKAKVNKIKHDFPCCLETGSHTAQYLTPKSYKREQGCGQTQDWRPISSLEDLVWASMQRLGKLVWDAHGRGSLTHTCSWRMKPVLKTEPSSHVFHFCSIPSPSLLDSGQKRQFWENSPLLLKWTLSGNSQELLVRILSVSMLINSRNTSMDTPRSDLYPFSRHHAILSSWESSDTDKNVSFCQGRLLTFQDSKKSLSKGRKETDSQPSSGAPIWRSLSRDIHGYYIGNT